MNTYVVSATWTRRSMVKSRPEPTTHSDLWVIIARDAKVAEAEVRSEVGKIRGSGRIVATAVRSLASLFCDGGDHSARHLVREEA